MSVLIMEQSHKRTVVFWGFVESLSLFVLFLNLPVCLWNLQNVPNCYDNLMCECSVSVVDFYAHVIFSWIMCFTWLGFCETVCIFHYWNQHFSRVWIWLIRIKYQISICSEFRNVKLLFLFVTLWGEKAELKKVEKLLSALEHSVYLVLKFKVVKVKD